MKRSQICRLLAVSSTQLATQSMATVCCAGLQYEQATCGFAARCAVLIGVLLVTTQPIGRPSRICQIRCSTRDRGRPLPSTVVTVHQTISEVSRRNSSSNAANDSAIPTLAFPMQDLRQL